MWSATPDDAVLVSATLDGDREAFAQIVRRYQTLVACIAYNATGSLVESEDLAQETFVLAWNNLTSLREPGKLRAWLCGIVRRIAANSLRRRRLEPTREAASLDAVEGIAAAVQTPDQEAINREQEAILWRSLEKLPDSYREPLILFYREDQSVEKVAQALDLSEDVVRQRLSRGRKMLEHEVATFVEGALRRSAPGSSFTLAVMGALPAHATAAGAASAGIAAAKTGLAAKAPAALGLISSLAAIAIGVLAAFLGFSTDMADADSARERKGVMRFYGVLGATVTVSLGFVLVLILAKALAITHPRLYTVLAVTCALSWIPAAAILLLWATGIVTTAPRERPDAPRNVRARYEYRSPGELLGLPLIHVRFGGGLAVRHRPVKAWIAIGDIAVAGMLAVGGVAVAPIAVGGFVLGGITLGGLGAGVFADGGFAIGVWAIGGLVIGVEAFGGFALGGIAAIGGVAVAGQLARGGIMVARHAGDALARGYFDHSAFFQAAPALMKGLLPGFFLAALPSVLMWRSRRRKQRRSPP